MKKAIILAMMMLTAPQLCTAAEYETVFKENMGKYTYAYPSTSTIEIAEQGAKAGRSCLLLVLDHKEYSGAAFAFSEPIDVSKIKETGSLEFWIKGGSGGERLEVALVNEQADGKKAESFLSVNSVSSVDSQWKKVEIPLKLFPKNGIYWDADKGKELPLAFDWKNVTEFKVRTRPTQGQDDIKLYFDDIVFTKDAAPGVNALVVFDGVFPSYTYAYPESGSKITISADNAFEGKPSAKIALDANDYSGAAFAFGPVDLSGMREAGVLEFMMKGGTGGEKVEVCLVQAAEPKVETGVNLSGIKPLTAEWQKYEIPLGMFQDRGKYWDDAAKKEISGDIKNWDKIGELKFKIRKGENKECSLYITDVKFRMK